MVTHAPRELSYAFLTTFILSECHHRSLIYLKKALTDILFQSKRSIRRFSVHRWCVILAGNSDLRTKKTIYTIENDIFSCPKLFNKGNKDKENTLTKLSMSKTLLHRWQNTHRHQGHRKHKDLSTIQINTKGHMYFRSHPVLLQIRGHKFDPDHGDWWWNNFYCHSPPYMDSRVTSESMCTKYWLTA